MAEPDRWRDALPPLETVPTLRDAEAILRERHHERQRQADRDA
jgi:hypothetical protein